MLVTVAAPRLRDLGLVVPSPSIRTPFPEHDLFDAVESRMQRGAHAEYNALIARIVSFARAYEATARTVI